MKTNSSVDDRLALSVCFSAKDSPSQRSKTQGPSPEQTARASAPQAGTMVRTTAGLEVVWIPPGEFTVGSSLTGTARDTMPGTEWSQPAMSISES